MKNQMKFVIGDWSDDGQYINIEDFSKLLMWLIKPSLPGFKYEESSVSQV